MLGSSDLVALIGVADLEQARAFYCGVLGLAVVGEDSHAVTVDAHGTLLRLTGVGDADAGAVLGPRVASRRHRAGRRRAGRAGRGVRPLRQCRAGRSGCVERSGRLEGGVVPRPGRQQPVAGAVRGVNRRW